eukprot:TRINITY_DN10993_c0_g1_i1.p1 TRINITY_DN10993_c0_g1~~TRINITY_DN10993_c0_g1_i1.p1  ORF type:complete len:368 (+),score=123.24 TRINITY_DN10993_c0_g1_i1:49-1152(+)
MGWDSDADRFDEGSSDADSADTASKPARVLKRGEIIGAGSYGIVYSATTADGSAVAVKAPRTIARGDVPGLPMWLVRELAVMRALGDEAAGVVPCLDVVVNSRSMPLVVMPAYDADLATALRGRGATLTAAELGAVVRGVAAGLRTLHAAGVVHRDVKPQNVLLSASRCAVVIADLGTARRLHEDPVTGAATPIEHCCTLPYCALEGLLGIARYTTAVDVWSLAVLAWEAWLGWHPFGDCAAVLPALASVVRLVGWPPADSAWPAWREDIGAMHVIVPAAERVVLDRMRAAGDPAPPPKRRRVGSPSSPSAEPEQLWRAVPEDAAQLLASCLRVEPPLRPSAADILRSPMCAAADSADVRLLLLSRG